MHPVLILKTGTAVDCVRAALGDFEDWFSAALGERYPVQVLDCTQNQLPACVETYTAIIVTGSAAMVSHRADWSERAGAWLKDAVAQGVPLLAVCYGHQLLAHAMGGTVGPNPNGRHIGSREIRLTEDGTKDALLSDLPTRFLAQTSHVESVLALPDGAVKLAEIDTDTNYAYRIGDNAWGLQFHPEFSADATRGYIRARSETLKSEGLDPDQLYEQVLDTPLVHALIKRFARLVINDPISNIRGASAGG